MLENSLENEENASNTYEGDMVQHEDITPYLNKTLEEIQDITQTQEISIRIVSEDGEAFPVTADYNPLSSQCRTHEWNHRQCFLLIKNVKSKTDKKA